MNTITQRHEAKWLAQRFGFKPAPVLKWMKANNIQDIPGLRRHFPNTDHAETMRLTMEAIEDFTFSN